MALIKTGPLITEIKGKIGGTVFKRDSSGLHAVAYPRLPNKIATAEGKRSRSWYAGKKREEAKGGPYMPPFEWPKEPTTGIVFSLEVLWAHRKPTLFQPTYEKIEYAGPGFEQLFQWVTDHWNPEWTALGYTMDFAMKLLMKWYWVGRSTYHMASSDAILYAVGKFEYMALQAPASMAVPLINLWVGIVALGFFFAFLDWLEGQSAFISFTKGRVLIWQNGQLWWGGLIARPTQKMYEFWKCRPTDFHSYYWQRDPRDEWAQLSWLYLNDLYQTLTPGFWAWYVYTWKTIKCRFRGYCYTVGPAVVRMECEPDQQQYWKKPVGWYQTVEPACRYLDVWNEYWEWRNNPQPPL